MDMISAYKVYKLSFEPATKSDLHIVAGEQRNYLNGVKSEMELQWCRDVTMYRVGRQCELVEYLALVQFICGITSNIVH